MPKVFYAWYHQFRFFILSHPPSRKAEVTVTLFEYFRKPSLTFFWSYSFPFIFIHSSLSYCIFCVLFFSPTRFKFKLSKNGAKNAVITDPYANRKDAYRTKCKSKTPFSLSFPHSLSLTFMNLFCPRFSVKPTVGFLPFYIRVRANTFCLIVVWVGARSRRN